MARVSMMLSVAWLAGCANQIDRTEVDDATVVTVRRDYGNAHLLRANGGAVLFDAGLEREAAGLDADLRAQGVDPADLDLIVLSHGHADHAGGAGWFQRTYGIPVLAGAGDATLLGEGHNDRLCPTDTTAEDRLATAQAETFTPFVPDVTVAAGTSVDLSAWSAVGGVVTAQPGHTPGSLVYARGGLTIVGDLLRGSVFGYGAARHFYMCDLDDNAHDVRELLDVVAPDADTVFVGHFGPLTRAEVERFVREELDVP